MPFPWPTATSALSAADFPIEGDDNVAAGRVGVNTDWGSHATRSGMQKTETEQEEMNYEQNGRDQAERSNRKG